MRYLHYFALRLLEAFCTSAVNTVTFGQLDLAGGLRVHPGFLSNWPAHFMQYLHDFAQCLLDAFCTSAINTITFCQLDLAGGLGVPP